MADILILVFFGFIWLVFKGISSAGDASAQAARNRQQQEKLKAKWGDRVIDKTKSLGERNADIVMKHMDRLRAGYQRSYYVENAVRDCIQDIAEAEGNLAMAPNHAYLSNWLPKANAEYKAVAERTLDLFRDRYRKLENEQKEKVQQIKIERISTLKTKYSDLIAQFREITERKVSLLDDYGEENWEVLDKEIDLVLNKIGKKEGLSEQDFKGWKKHSWNMPEEYRELSSFLEQSFKEYHDRQKRKPVESTTDFSQMKGTEFEAYLMKLLAASGFSDIRGTPATGDQGADLLARKNGKNIVIQAKRYESTVGNKAVQEVVSAVSFYSADEGWVITNSTFTKSAKELAQRTNIKLIDGFELARFREQHS